MRSRMSRALRWFLATVLAPPLLLAVAAGAAWVWAGTEGSAAWALRLAASRLPLQAEGVSGALRGPLQARRLAWSQDGLQVEATGVELAWQPQALLQRRLQLDRLHVGSLSVTDQRPPAADAARPPASLALPWAAALDQLEVLQVHLSGPADLALSDLRAAWSWDGSRHHLVLRSLQLAGGRYQGEARLAGQPPFQLQAGVQGALRPTVPGAVRTLPLALSARAQGPLERLALTLDLEGPPGAAGAARATVRATVTPWGPVSLPQAVASLQALDLALLWPQAPQTALSGQLQVTPREAGQWTVQADLRNGLRGPWDRGRLPLDRLEASLDWAGGSRLLVRSLLAQVGPGQVQARGRWEDAQDWRVDAGITRLDPADLHGALASLPLSGTLQLRGQGQALAFETEVAAAGQARRATAAEAARAEALAALQLRFVRARGRWAGGALALPVLQVQAGNARLDGSLDLQPAARSGRGTLLLEAPGLRLRAAGSLAPRQGGGTVRLQADALERAQDWLRRLPLVPAGSLGPALSGRADLQADWQGGWDDPTVQATLDVPRLQAAGAGPAWMLQGLVARLDGRLADARLDLKATAQAGARRLDLEAQARAGRATGDSWRGELGRLALQARDPALSPGPWRLDLRQPVSWRWAGGQFDLGAGQASLAAPVAGAPAVLAWEPALWRPGQLHSAGRLTGLPLAWLDVLGGPLAATPVSGDLVFDGRWDLRLGEQLRLSAQLVRVRGDLSVQAEAADGTPARLQAGVRAASLGVDSDGDALRATLRWDSERAGQAQGQLATRLVRDAEGWTWPADAPLEGRLQARLPRLGVWSLLAPPGWRLRGSLAADLSVAGSRASPVLGGQLRADDMALRSVVEGIALQDGRLRARLDGDRLLLDELVLQGAGPQGGRVAASGEARWTAAGPQVAVQARIERLRASVRPDRALTTSGRLEASLDGQAARLQGALRIDSARIQLPAESAPRLGEDVQVRNLPAGARWPGRGETPAEGAREAPGRPVQLAVSLDFGDDFQLEGRGIRTRLAGTLAVSGDALAQPRLQGVVRTVGGAYQAYGQQLDIARGELRFTGPADNPVLDILALRPRLTQKVGVQVTGTAQVPVVRLVAEPELPEAEKLSWLVLGRASASGGAEAALLQQAAVALLDSRRGAGSGRSPAALLGLDELGVRRDSLDGPAVTLGKRLGQNLYASYEQGLAGAMGTLYVFYDLSRRVTVRAQAGERSAVDLIFTFAYD